MSPLWGVICAVLMFMAWLLIKNIHPQLSHWRLKLIGDRSYAHKKETSVVLPVGGDTECTLNPTSMTAGHNQTNGVESV